MREQERASRKYELMTILHPEVAEEALPGELDRIAGFIGAAGGELIERLQDSPWGRRRLAYPIRSGGRDVRDGYYTVWHFNLAPNRVDELERELKLDTQLIRYIVLTWEPKPLDPKEIEAAEIAAEDAAAAAYAAAQAAAAAEAAAQEEPAAAVVASGEETSAIEPVAAEEAREEVLAAAAAAETTMQLAADDARAEELTAQAEAAEDSGAELAIEAVAEVAEREELQTEAAAALAQAEAVAAAEDAAEKAAVPEGAVRGDGTGECPEDYPIKGNATSMLYHSPGSPSYKRTVPEFCFASTDAAEAAGFNPTKYEAAQEEGS